MFAEPDAGIWELRGLARVHTFSSVMCWVACDRLAKIAQRFGLPERSRYWRSHAERIHQVISTHAWNEKRGTFWYIDALVGLGRREEARALFESMLACRNRHGLLAEHIDPRTREQWGNFPQTYSMVGLIVSATRLSIPWYRAF